MVASNISAHRAEPDGDRRIDVQRALLDCVPLGLVSLEADGTVLTANAAARRALGLPDVAGRISKLGDMTATDATSRTLLDQLVAGNLEGPVRLTTRHGGVLSAARHEDEKGAALLVFTPDGFADGQSARCDSLTGLADRHLFQERLEALCATNHKVALLMVDLDRFKGVNDSLGHQAGDAVLRLAARRIRSIFRSADVIARLGGDEFAIALAAPPDIISVAERLVTVLSNPYLVEQHSTVIGASVGIALGPEHGSDPASLIRAADLALYKAKADGRGVVRAFDSELDQRSRYRHSLAEDLRRAIPLQELTLFFQPQICLSTHALTGFEALIRWPHKTRGLISPEHFIPLAEETGIIIPLGEWVLHEACRQAMTWAGELCVAVNVSPKQLFDRNRLPAQIAAALKSSGLPAHRLEIEITETALIREAEALEVLRAVRALGVRISMDDFGTGYSSLSQLRRFPFDKLKIDRSFVRDLGESAEAAAVVRAIAALGKSLGMATIAEGVETPDQEDICRIDGCTAMQGYLVSRPVPSEQISELMQRIELDRIGRAHG